ncbi:MAG TPA: 2-dehydro-3-deoxyphosphogluconate aldolase [Thermoanaerobaculia bacterium]|jgi:2-dehydro-3-deoxyphosphogluconate aldolase/(4S)-4-hydroxy-2-oxoglutarate aldolase|nr:2-dehydro-3-deoxyphosphogluconate aldolase [Thermoanaerobaculia bacterium]
MTPTVDTRALVAQSLRLKPIIGVVRTTSTDEAARQARALIKAGLELIEVTFTVPGAAGLARQLIAERGAAGPPWIGIGTVTTAVRAGEALAAGAEFLVSPNVNAAVAAAARAADRFLVLGALTPTEIVAAHELGADLVKVYPLPPVGGPAYLATVRQPLGDIPMLAAGGFGIGDIPAYLQAGASAFGIGFPLLAGRLDAPPTVIREHVARGLRLALAAASLSEPTTGGEDAAGEERP